MYITGTTRICGIIGNPVEHSLSPQMHNAAFKALQLDYVYLPFKVEKNKLKDALPGLKALKVIGFNITVPHKIAALRSIDRLDRVARRVGSVNTVVNVEGKFVGYNTDGKAAAESLRVAGAKIEDGRIAILGAGGAARAIAFSLVEHAACIKIFNRTGERAKQLATALRKERRINVEGFALQAEDLKEKLSDSDVIVNATSVGMWPRSDESLLEAEWIPPGVHVFDIVYRPLETKLLRAAEEAGAVPINGLEMLVRQGAASFELWTGQRAPLEIMRNTIAKYLAGE